jgi:hypothetical protein
MKEFFNYVFKILFVANIICIAVLSLLLIQLQFPHTLGGDVFEHFARIARTLKILCFWGFTNIVIVLLYILKYKQLEFYKELVIMWVIIFSATYFFVGSLLFKDTFWSMFI